MKNEKILFFAPHGLWQIIHIWDAIIFLSLRLRGFDTHLIRCDGIYGEEDCYLQAKPSITCETCIKYGDNLFGSLNIPADQIRNYIQEKDFHIVHDWVESYAPDEYISAEYNGKPIGEWVVSSLYSRLSVTRDYVIKPKNKIVKKFYKKFLFDGLITYIAFNRIIKAINPTKCFLLNGRFIPYRIAWEAAKENNIEIIMHCSGHLNSTRTICNKGYMAQDSPIWMNERFKLWEKIPLLKKEIDLVKEYFLIHREENNTFSKRKDYYTFKDDDKKLLKMLNIPPGKKIISVFTTSEWELAVFIKNIKIQLQIIDKLIELFKNRDEYLVIRHHPYIAEGYDDVGTDFDYMSRAYKQALEAPDNVRIIMPSEKISSYTLTWNSEASFSFYSTMGLEVAFRGLPVVTSSESAFWPASQLVIEQTDSQTLENAIDWVLKKHNNSINDNLRIAYRYGYHLIERTAIRLKSIDQKSEYVPRLMIDNVDQLKENVDPNLDWVCNRIIDGGDFIKDPSNSDYSRSNVEEDLFIENEVRLIQNYKKIIRKKNELYFKTNEIKIAIFEVFETNSCLNSFLRKTLKKSRYKSFTIHDCFVSDINNWYATADSVFEQLQSIDEQHVVIANPFYGYDEAFLSSANNFFLNNDSKNYHAILFGGWILSSIDNYTVHKEILTKRLPVDQLRNSNEINDLIILPHNILSFCVFEKEALCIILKSLSKMKDRKKAVNFIFNMLSSNIVYRSNIPMVLCYLPDKQKTIKEEAFLSSTNIKKKKISHLNRNKSTFDYERLSNFYRKDCSLFEFRYTKQDTVTPSIIPLLINKEIEKKGNINILDVGCGAGGSFDYFFKNVFKKEAISYTGIDSSEKQIENARKDFNNSNFSFFVCDAHSIKFPDNSFHIVFENSVSSHFIKPIDALKEMVRVSSHYIYFQITTCSEGISDFHAHEAELQIIGNQIKDIPVQLSEHGIDKIFNHLLIQTEKKDIFYYPYLKHKRSILSEHELNNFLDTFQGNVILHQIFKRKTRGIKSNDNDNIMLISPDDNWQYYETKSHRIVLEKNNLTSNVSELKISQEKLPSIPQKNCFVNGKNIIFIVGCPRSGTTWLQKLLAYHPKVFTGQESDLFDMFIGSQLRSWKKFQYGEYTQRPTGLKSYMTEEQFISTLKEYLNALLKIMIGDLKNDEFFIEKTPSHALFISEINELLPKSKFIHVLRDVRDVVVSTLAASKSWGKTWAPNDASSAAQMWQNHVKAIQKSKRHLSENQFFEVRYEDLSNNTEKVLKNVYNFLELEWEESNILKAIIDNTFEVTKISGGTPILIRGEYASKFGKEIKEPDGFFRKGKVGQWMNDLSQQELSAISQISQATMEELGYMD